MAIKVTAKNKKLNGKFAGIEFKNGVANVDGGDKEKRKAIVFAERSGLKWEDTKDAKKEAPKKDDKK